MRAALVQMRCVEDKAVNVETAVRHVRAAAKQGAELVCLQEFFNTLYFPVDIDARHFALAEPIPGPSTDAIAAVARECGVVVVVPLYEKEFDGQLFNSAAVIDARGEVVGVYRKSSIPMTKTEWLEGHEKFYFRPGNTGFLTFDVGVGARFGILICYDRHFPEAARVLALQGAELILAPSATAGRSREAWEVELRAHAIQNMCFVGGVNRVGDESGYDWYGSAVWIDPRGAVIARAGDEHDEVLVADLDFNAVTAVRREWGFFRDRRPDLYGALTE